MGITRSSTHDEIEKIAHRIMMELETASSRDLADVHYAKTILQLSDLHYTNSILQEIESVSSGAEGVIEKRAVIKVLLLSTWLQRLYFIIRSFLMALISTLITLGFVSYFGTIGTTEALIIGMIVFVASLVITRFFDVQIVKATKNIVMRLGSHRTIRDFIMNHF
ncbi:MAG: hypothetical protein J5U17_00560 [Candidatus Methanoperedens sp.]|nr:hypothetical protein [Candidatus Methanoperedens sp.]MCE8429302.1 hypothetical protein [Candidatus Methanoperedens sp.]